MRKTSALSILLATSLSTNAMAAQRVPLQTLLNQGFRVVAAIDSIQKLFIQKDNIVYLCEDEDGTKFMCHQIH